MRKTLLIIAILCLLLAGCRTQPAESQIVATTMPVYTICRELCQGTDLSVTQLIQDDVSCLHNYTLQVGQMQLLERSEVVVTNGAGLEDFLEDALSSVKRKIDASQGIDLYCKDEFDHEDHHHDNDPHIWLSPVLASQMADNICRELSGFYPEHSSIFENNLTELNNKLARLLSYGQEQLSTLSTRNMITFHDGFHYFAQCFDLNIVAAIEEESGSETSAANLIKLIQIMKEYDLPAVFTEVNSSTASANIVASETGVKTYTLDMSVSQGDYFEIMYRNIDTVKEALG